MLTTYVDFKRTKTKVFALDTLLYYKNKFHSILKKVISLNKLYLSLDLAF